MRKQPLSVDYMCVYCGRKVCGPITMSRPQPGICPRRKNNMPHRWIVARKY